MFDFSKIGLSGRDKRVYEALLTLRHASVRAIAQHTGINRGSAYESLQALQKAGLAGFTTYGKRQRYVAHNPQVLHEIVDEKRRSLSLAHDDIDLYAASLRATQHSNETIPFASSYEGNEGLASILRDVLATLKASKRKSYRVISTSDLHEYLYYNFKNYTHERIKNGIAVKVIAHAKGTVATKADLAERRVLASDIKPPRCYTIIYGTKTAFIALSDTNLPHGAIIDNPDITNLQIALFDKLWRELGPS